MVAYPQRTDLQTKLPVATAKSKTYGDVTASRQAQQAVPMGNPKRPPSVPLSTPSQRPDEPITSGANFGPGPGSEMLGQNLVPATGGKDDLALRLRAVASQFPTAALLGLIAELESPDA